MISIRQTTWFTYEDANGYRRWIEGSNVASGTQGEIYIDSGNDRFRYCESNGQVREVAIGQTSSTGSKGEVYVTGKRWAWCPSDGTEHSRRGDRNTALGFDSFSLTNNTYSGSQDVELNYSPKEVPNYLTQKFDIERRPQDEQVWTELATGVTSTQYFDDTVEPNTDYTYRVEEVITTVGGQDVGSYSTQKNITTADEQTTSVSVTVGSFKTSSNSWDMSASPSEGSSPYSYQWSEANGKFVSWSPSDTVQNPSVTADFAGNGDEYTFECVVTDDNGNTASDSVTVTAG